VADHRVAHRSGGEFRAHRPCAAGTPQRGGDPCVAGEYCDLVAGDAADFGDDRVQTLGGLIAQHQPAVLVEPPIRTEMTQRQPEDRHIGVEPNLRRPVFGLSGDVQRPRLHRDEHDQGRQQVSAQKRRDNAGPGVCLGEKPAHRPSIQCVADAKVSRSR
jgi:hypothetical protein